MAQSNQVMIAGGSTVGSVRHVNVKAGKVRLQSLSLPVNITFIQEQAVVVP